MTYTYSWANAEQTNLKRVDSEGFTLWINAEVTDGPEYQEFLESGAVAAPYVAPPEPPPLTTEEKVNRLLSDYGLTRDEMQSALLAKGSTMPETID